MNPENEFIPDNEPLPDVSEDIQWSNDIVEKGGNTDGTDALNK